MPFLLHSFNFATILLDCNAGNLSHTKNQGTVKKGDRTKLIINLITNITNFYFEDLTWSFNLQAMNLNWIINFYEYLLEKWTKVQTI